MDGKTDSALDKHSRVFNQQLLFLGRVYIEKKKNTFDEEQSHLTYRRLSMVIGGYPNWMIETMGPVILKYGNLIHQKKWDECMKQDFSAEKAVYSGTDDGKKHTPRAMDVKIKFIKKVWSSSNAKEREKIADCLTAMLSSYCEFALEIKKRAKP